MMPISQASVSHAVAEVQAIQGSIWAVDYLFQDLNKLIYRIMMGKEFLEEKEMQELFNRVLRSSVFRHYECTKEEFVGFLQQFTLPENRIEVASGQYVLAPYYPRSEADMVGEKVRVLAELPRYSAYMKYVAEENEVQVTKKEKLETKPLPAIQKGDAYRWAKVKGYFYGKPRGEIDKDINARWENQKSTNTNPSLPKEPPAQPKPPPDEPPTSIFS